MCKIYLYEGSELHGEKAYKLIEMAATMYIAESNFGIPEKSAYAELQKVNDNSIYGDLDFEIDLTENGKPFFVNLPLEFSVTNCSGMWMCAISENPCGVDLQVARKAPGEKIAERFFKPEEAEYVKRVGEEGFFRIWTRREAYGKMIGEGFWGDIPSLVCEDDSGELLLLDSIGEFTLSDIEIGEGIYCAVCTADRGPYPIVLL